MTRKRTVLFFGVPELLAKATLRLSPRTFSTTDMFAIKSCGKPYSMVFRRIRNRYFYKNREQ